MGSIEELLTNKKKLGNLNLKKYNIFNFLSFYFDLRYLK